MTDISPAYDGDDPVTADLLGDYERFQRLEEEHWDTIRGLGATFAARADEFKMLAACVARKRDALRALEEHGIRKARS